MKPYTAVLLLALVACDRPDTDAPKSGELEPEPEAKATPDPEPKPEPIASSTSCMPAELEAATKLETIVLARGCLVESGTLTAPTILRSPEQLSAGITCDSASQPPSVDFAKHQLHVASFSLSPAYAGHALVDDGETVTYVQRDRSPCAGDPLPMPISSTLTYLLPSGAERSYAQRSCSVPPKCP